MSIDDKCEHPAATIKERVEENGQYIIDFYKFQCVMCDSVYTDRLHHYYPSGKAIDNNVKDMIYLNLDYKKGKND